MQIRSATRLLQFIALSTALMAARTGAAQGSSTRNPDDDGWVPVKHLEFSPDDVQGGLLGPEGEPIISVPRARHPSLIEIRSGFEAELVKTMETL